MLVRVRMCAVQACGACRAYVCAYPYACVCVCVCVCVCYECVYMDVKGIT